MRTRAALVAALSLAAAATPVLSTVSGAGSAQAATPHWKPRAASYGVAKQQNVPITMDDGKILEADILRPAAADGTPAKGRFPVLLTQTPYNKSAPQLNFENDYLVQRGYIQVIVDVRGTGSSQGEWTSFGPREQQDYCRTAAWAVKVPGSDGVLGLYGISYGAIDQIYTAACHPRGLKAMFPIVPMGDAYRDVTVSGGQVDTGFIPFWLGLVTGAGLGVQSAQSDPAEAGQALADHAQGILDFQAQTIASATTGMAINDKDGAYAGEFYDDRSPLRIINKVDVPTFVVGGEYDLFQRSEPLIYNALRARGVPTRLLIGPWTHLDASSGAGLPADGVPTLNDLELRWFDHYLRGVKDPRLFHDIAPVTAWRLGAGHYERATSYPPAGTGYTSLRLGGTATPGSPGTLGRATDGTGTIAYLPVAGACSESTAQWTAGVVPTGEQVCTGDHRVNDNLGVTYDLPIVGGKALRIAGTSRATLFVSTTRSDAFVTARLEDVGPDGTSTPLTSGWQVLSLRKVDRSKSVFRNGMMIQPWHPDTRESVLPVTSGTVYELDVEIFPTLATLPSGHTLRLALQTSDEPHATAPLPQAANSAGGILTVYSSAKYPSALVLGVQR
jgi:putative CocE/NonD family hydrolase